MAYTKQNWECGDLITADKMNHIEDGLEEASSGGGSEPLIINAVDTDPANSSAKSETSLLRSGEVVAFDIWLDKTWQEIYNAHPNVIVRSEPDGITHEVTGGVILTKMERSGDAMYAVTVVDTEGRTNFMTSVTSGYPKLVTE